MERRAALAALLWCSAIGVAVAVRGDPCSGDVTLGNQEQVDQWNCTELAGTLHVQGEGVSSLRPLWRLTRIAGGLVVWWTAKLQSLEGLHNVQSVGLMPGRDDTWRNVSLMIVENDALESLMGLRAVRGAVPGGMLIMGNPRLTSLDGLDNITGVGMTGAPTCSIVLKNNARLESLRGLRNVGGHLPGSLEVILHPKLRTLDGLQSITGADRFSATGNLVLESLTDLRLRGFVGIVLIIQNRALQTLQGLEGVWRMDELNVDGNEVLSSLAALGNTTVTRKVEIENNPGLRSLHGLDMLTTAEKLIVSGNANLESVDGLCNIRGKVGAIQFSALDKLTSLQCFADVERYTLQDLGINPPLCFPEGARRKLADQPADQLSNVPPASWDYQRCHNCTEPCGTYEGKFVACDYLSGTCRCPLGRYGPSCTAVAPVVSVVAGQVHDCHRPAASSMQETCRVSLQIRRDAAAVGGSSDGPRAFGVYDGAGRSLFDAEQSPNGLLCNWTGCAEVGLSGDLQVAWLSDLDGVINMSVSVGYGGMYEDNLTLTLHVGYHAQLYPDSLLDGTLAHPPRTPSPPVYPWCLDSGDCVQISSVPVQLVVHGHGPVCGAGWVPDGTSCVSCAHGEVAAAGATSCSECGMWGAPDPSNAVCLFRWQLCLALACGLLCIVAGATMLCMQVEWTARHPFGADANARPEQPSGEGQRGHQPTGWQSHCRLPVGVGPQPVADVNPWPERPSGESLKWAERLSRCRLPFAGRSIPIEDVALERDVLVVLTARPHGLRVSKRAFCVAFEGTHPDLDKPSFPMRARVVADDKLELFDSAGPLTKRLDASKGVLRLSVGRALWHTWRFPVGVLGPTLFGIGVGIIVVAGSISGQAGHGIGSLGLAVLTFVGLAAAGATRLTLAWRRGCVRTLLERRLQDYLQGLPASPKVCDQAPNRAITAGQLKLFYDHFRPFIRDRATHYVVHNIIKPLTAPSEARGLKSGVSFAELVGPSPLLWFVSHCWKQGFGQLCLSVQKHAQAMKLGPWEDQAYWICSFSNNQHDVKAELGMGLKETSFYKALDSQGCKGTCLVVDERALPLTRSWCLFEVVQTIEIEKADRPDFKGLLFCTPTGVMNFGKATVETSTALARCVSSIKLQDAEATEATDKEKIDHMIETERGGFDAMNNAVKERLRTALEETKDAALAEFKEVDEQLKGVGAVAVSWQAGDHTGRRDRDFPDGEPPPVAATLLVSRNSGLPGGGKHLAAGAETTLSQPPADRAQPCVYGRGTSPRA